MVLYPFYMYQDATDAVAHPAGRLDDSGIFSVHNQSSLKYPPCLLSHFSSPGNKKPCLILKKR
jgi:hypothetical protein